MENCHFDFRTCKDSDADILYEAAGNYLSANIQPYLSGTGTGLDRDALLENIRQLSRKQHRPPIIVNAEDTPCGIYRITYHHANRYHELMLHLWDARHLAKPVLRKIIDQALRTERPEDNLLIEIPGYETELKASADDLGLDHSGTIPNYLCHNGGLFHKYIYVVSSKKWHSRADSSEA